MCQALPVSAAISRSRATITSSASAGAAVQAQPRRGRALVHHRVAFEIGVLAVRDERVRQVGGVARGVAQHARVAHRRAVVAERDAARIGEQMVRRELLAGARPWSSRRPGTRARARRRRRAARPRRRSLAESSAGSVFGMHATAVKPPATAAAAPVAIVSLCVCPGSRRWTCMSMKPGATIAPAASTTRASARVERARRSRVDERRSRSARRAARRAPASGSISRPPRIERLHAGTARAVDQQIEHRHAHEHAVAALARRSASADRRARRRSARRRGCTGPGCRMTASSRSARSRARLS